MNDAGPSQSWAQFFRHENMILKSLIPGRSKSSSSSEVSSAKQPTKKGIFSPFNLHKIEKQQKLSTERYYPLMAIGLWATHEKSFTNSLDFEASLARFDWLACNRHTVACMHRLSFTSEDSYRKSVSHQSILTYSDDHPGLCPSRERSLSSR